MSWFRLLKRPLIVVSVVLFIDQFSKILVKTNMLLGEEISVFGNWFLIHFTENNGMAFGMEFSGDYGKLFLSIFRIIAIIAIGWYIYKLCLEKASKGLIISLSLIFAGALGNMIDSAFYGVIFNQGSPYIPGITSDALSPAVMFPEGGGYSSLLHGRVVDMLYFPLFSGNFPDWFPFWGGEDFLFFRPVFNIADSSITVGVALIILFQRSFFKKSVEKEQQPLTKSEKTTPN